MGPPASASQLSGQVLVRLRRMVPADVPQVATIELHSSPWPWEEELFESCFRSDYYSLVAERRGAVLGFAISTCAAGEGHLLNLAVQPGMRRGGIGGRLLHGVLAHFRRSGADCAILEVRQSNRVAMDLYRACGFESIGIRKDYYRLGDGREHAVVMKRSLGQGS